MNKLNIDKMTKPVQLNLSLWGRCCCTQCERGVACCGLGVRLEIPLSLGRGLTQFLHPFSLF